MEENIKNTTAQESDARVYEVSYLLTPAVEEGEIATEYGNLKAVITSLGGEAIADEMPRKIELAYTFEKVIQNIKHKFDTAYFGWFKFAMDAEKVNDLKKKLDLDTKIIRHLIIKTVRENTVASKRFVRSAEGGVTRKYTPKVRSEGEIPVEINKEEIDKEIDAMVEA